MITPVAARCDIAVLRLTQVHTIAADLADQIESAIMHKKFDEAGAILLNEHVRLLVESLSELVSGSVRGDFGRLSQIIFLLTAGTVQEATALLLSTLATPSGGRNTQITKAQAARILSLRVEFSDDAIRELLPEMDDGEA